jgi:DNA polymerase-3 subunit alpha
MIKECRAMELTLLPPDINSSEYMFTVNNDNAIVYGLGAVKGVGEGAIEELVNSRQESAYTDLFDLCRRVDLKKTNRRVLESLIRAGALDSLGINRATLIAQIPMALKMAEQHHAMLAAGQNDLFSISESKSQEPAVDESLLPTRDEWQDEQRLQGEMETLGLYLTGHPLDQYEADLTALGVTRLETIANMTPSRDKRAQRIRIAGRVEAIARRETQRGPMATVLLDDKTASLDIPFFSDALEKMQDYLQTGQLLMIEGSLSYDSYRESMSIRGDNVISLEEARILYASSVSLKIDRHYSTIQPDKLLNELSTLLTPVNDGQCHVYIEYLTNTFKGCLVLGENWRIKPTNNLLQALYQRFGKDAIRVGYQQTVHSRSAQNSV